MASLKSVGTAIGYGLGGPGGAAIGYGLGDWVGSQTGGKSRARPSADIPWYTVKPDPNNPGKQIAWGWKDNVLYQATVGDESSVTAIGETTGKTRGVRFFNKPDAALLPLMGIKTTDTFYYGNDRIPQQMKMVEGKPVLEEADSAAKTLAQETKTAEAEAKAANEARYQEILQGYGQTATAGSGGYGDIASTIATGYGNLASQTQQGYSGLLDRLLSMQQGAGEQEKADIATAYRGKETAAQQDLISRGLANTSIMPSVSAGYQRAMNADLARVNEAYRQQQLGLVQGLGTQALQTQTQLGQNQLSDINALAQNQLGYQQGLQQNKLNFMANRMDTYPNLAQYLQMMYQMGAGGT